MTTFKNEAGQKITLNEIKEMANDERVNKIWLYINEREAIIFPKKYGKRWWKSANETDILRVAIY